MYEIEYTGLFKRKVKLLKKRGYDLTLLEFFCHYFNLQKEELLCYTRKQSSQARISFWCKGTLTGVSSPTD